MFPLPYFCDHTIGVTQEEKIESFLLIGRLLNRQVLELNILLGVSHDCYLTDSKT